MESMDMIAKNIELLESIFPSCVIEQRDEQGKLVKAVDFRALEEMLSEKNGGGGTALDERYEFTWVGKNDSKVEANTTTNKTLRPCIEESENWDNTENLYIEGNNLEVLKLLQNSYFNKVKMIYIDPPYNTGKDYIYKDKFSQSIHKYKKNKGFFSEDGNRLFKNIETNGRFYSNWCSMIYPRLVLARNLLTDDGIIFISIDDKEQSDLKKICDEIFGNNNCIAVLPTIMNLKGNQDEFGFAGTHEYILCYSKNKEYVKLNNLKVEENSDEWLQDEVGLYKKGATLKRTGIDAPREKRPFSFFPILIKDNRIYSIKQNEYNLLYDKSKTFFDDKYLELLKKEYQEKGYIVLLPIINNQYSSWRWSYSKVEKDKNEIIIIKTKNEYSLYKKQRPELGDIPTKKPKSILYKPEYSSGNGTSQLKKIFDNKIFDNPKPIELIKDLLTISVNNNDLVLDFFSGSSTTAHAVMQLNAEDGGKRNFIMVQLPEETDEKSEAFKAGYKNICEIGKERIRRAGEKIKEEAGINGQYLDIGFRVLKLDSSNMKDIYYSADKYDQNILQDMQLNIKKDRTDLDLFFGCLVDWGLELDKPYTIKEINDHKVHIYNDGDLVACFERDLDMQTIEEIAKLQPLRVVFRDSSFVDTPMKINVGERFKMLAPDTDIKVI